MPGHCARDCRLLAVYYSGIIIVKCLHIIRGGVHVFIVMITHLLCAYFLWVGEWCYIDWQKDEEISLLYIYMNLREPIKHVNARKICTVCGTLHHHCLDCICTSKQKQRLNNCCGDDQVAEIMKDGDARA